METNDYLGSFAQENVVFTTGVVKTNVVGDNFWKVMIFVENDRFVTSSDEAWQDVPGSSTLKALSVDASTYTEFTTGVLQSWLYDLFCNGFTGNCILVACAPMSVGDTPSNEEFLQNMETAYGLLKAYAYHKTVCAAPTLSTDVPFAVDTEVAVALAKLCNQDKNILSSVPYYPYSSVTPGTLSTDPLYTAIMNDGTSDAFMSAHQDASRNASLFALGLSLSITNGSGTPVGNAIDMWKTNMITSSGSSGMALDKPARDILTEANIQYWKPIGDNSGNVAAYGWKSVKGEAIQANWIISYITYMSKVNIAKLLTTPNFLRNESNYARIVNILQSQINVFGPGRAGKLEDIQITAPSFSLLPPSSEEIVIDDAWTASFVDQVRKVRIKGTLYIGGNE